MIRYKDKYDSYFYPALFILFAAICVFICFKSILPARLFPESEFQSTNIVIDSLALTAMAECDSIGKDSIDSRPAVDFSTSGNMEGHSNLLDFYDKLYKLENSERKSIRIAYFSDSMTDGDFIVQDIRSLFQDKFGGKGVGFVSITSLSALSRHSVSHHYSKDWQTSSFLKGSQARAPFGIDGQVSFVSDSTSSFVEYKANDLNHCEYLYNPVLFYGKSTNEQAFVNVSATDENASQKELVPSDTLNTLALSSTNPKRIKLVFHRAYSVPFYGVNFDDGKGVHVDNYSMRGNSGLPLSILNTSLLKSFDNKLQYDLIIIHYGANVLGYGTTDYSWYEKKMLKVVEHLNNCFRNANVIIVSSADKSSKQEMEMKTDKAVIPLISTQRHYAKESGSAFINLYNLMGGDGSMVKWVDEEKPPLANKDYTHFNANGSKKVATLIYKEIESGYLKYKRMKEIGNIN
ncbi:SGNH/GDSL hydrolase family protein [Viscerimonas tarda]